MTTACFAPFTVVWLFTSCFGSPASVRHSCILVGISYDQTVTKKIVIRWLSLTTIYRRPGLHHDFCSPFRRLEKGKSTHSSATEHPHDSIDDDHHALTHSSLLLLTSQLCTLAVLTSIVVI